MESNKTQEFINRLAEKTARNEFDWKLIEENIDALQFLKKSDFDFRVNENSSYWVDTTKQRIFLIDSFDLHKIVLINLNSNDSYAMTIEPSSYYRLESLIRNSHLVRDRMLDDFLND